MFWNENPNPESQSQSQVDTVKGIDETEPEVLAKRSIRELVGLAKTIAEMEDRESKMSSMMLALVSAILNISELFKMALQVIGRTITDEMVEMIEQHVKNGGTRPPVRHLAVICGMPICNTSEMVELLKRQLSPDAMSFNELIRHVESKIPPNSLMKMSKKWADPAHVRIATIKHLEDTLALLTSDKEMTDPELLKELMDCNLVVEAAISLSDDMDSRKMYVSRLLKFQSLAGEPSLAEAKAESASS